MDGTIESFEFALAVTLEREVFPETQLLHYAGDDDLFRLRVGTQPRSQLNCRTEQILLFFDRLTTLSPTRSRKAVSGFSLL